MRKGFNKSKKFKHIKQANVQSGQAELGKTASKVQYQAITLKTNQEPTKATKAKAKNQEG